MVSLGGNMPGHRMGRASVDGPPFWPSSPALWSSLRVRWPTGDFRHECVLLVRLRVGLTVVAVAGLANGSLFRTVGEAAGETFHVPA